MSNLSIFFSEIQVQLNADNVFSDAAGDFLHLQSITISELITEQHLYFPINIWLKPDCKFEIEPRPFPKHEVQPGPQITKKYTGVITTGDKLLAGTNANVHIYLTDTKVNLCLRGFDFLVPIFLSLKCVTKARAHVNQAFILNIE